MPPSDWADLAAADLDTLWLLSYTEEANEQIASTIAGLADEIGRPLRIERAAVASADPERARLPETVQHGRLVAVIFVLEPEAIDNRRLDELSRWLVIQAMEDPGVRVFICLVRLTKERVRELAQQRHPLFSNLVDTIQIDSQMPLREGLSAHLGHLRVKRTARAFRRLELTGLIFLGRTAFFIELACVAAAAMTALPISFPHLLQKEIIAPTTLTVVLGTSVFPLLSGPLYVVLHGTRGLLLLEDRPLKLALLGLAAALSISALYVCDKAGAGWSWTALGLVSGVLLEAARRSRLQARRVLVSPTSIIRTPPDLHTLYVMTRRAFALPHPWRCPLLSLSKIDVFLSYACASQWGSAITLRLHNALADEGLTTFLDRRDIAAGSAWRGTLQESVGETRVFVAALDPEAMRRPWVAAEVTAALIGRASAFSPHIVFLTDRHPNDFPPDDDRHPVFSVLLERIKAGGPEAPPCCVIRKPDEASKIPGVTFRNLAAHSALLPPPLVLPVLFAVFVAALPGSLALPAGAAAWLLGTLQIWGKYDTAAMLTAHGSLYAVYIACAFLLGFGMRSLVVARMRESEPLLSIPMDVLALAGFLVALGAWFPYVDALIVGWAFVAWPCGFIAASVFFHVFEKRSDGDASD